MSIQLNLADVAAHLRKIQREHGDETLRQALTGLFKNLLGKPEGEAYIERVLAELGNPIDISVLKAEARRAAEAQAAAPPKSPADVVLEAIKKEMPNCKTQAHFDVVVQSWEALRLYLNASYGRDPDTAAKARQGLNRLLDLAPQVADLHQKLEETPEATTNRDYVEPPYLVTEHQKQSALLAELGTLQSRDQLQSWYQRARPVMDSIVTQKLRDQLFDAIREKKRVLEN